MNKLCANCNAACCRHVMIRVANLTADQERWARMHGELRGNCWYLPAPCKHVTPAGKCAIYEQRPEQCRTFEVDGPDCKRARAQFQNLENKTLHD